MLIAKKKKDKHYQNDVLLKFSGAFKPLSEVSIFISDFGVLVWMMSKNVLKKHALSNENASV